MEDFVENVTTSFAQFRNDKDFSDVTLACGDGSQIKAHRIILMSGSLMFKALLEQNLMGKPVVFLRGVKSSQLTSIVDFLYLGEVNIEQDNLNEFLALAEDLQLKGLTQTQSQTQTGEKVLGQEMNRTAAEPKYSKQQKTKRCSIPKLKKSVEHTTRSKWHIICDTRLSKFKTQQHKVGGHISRRIWCSRNWNWQVDGKGWWKGVGVHFLWENWPEDQHQEAHRGTPHWKGGSLLQLLWKTLQVKERPSKARVHGPPRIESKMTSSLFKNTSINRSLHKADQHHLHLWW